MNDDANNETERKLRELGRRLRRGLRSRHSDITKNAEAVEDVIIEQTASETGKSVKELKEKVKKERDAAIPGPAPDSETEREREET
jgi:hypothetical protein